MTPRQTFLLFYSHIYFIDQATGFSIEYRIHPANCPIKWIRSEGEVRSAPTGRTQRLIGLDTNITEYKNHQQKLTALHSVATTLATETDRRVIFDQTIDAAVEILAFDWCVLLTPEGDTWRIVAASSDAPAEQDERLPESHDGAADWAYQTGDSRLTGDAESDDISEPTREGIQSGLTIPVGEYGVFQAVAAEPNAFDERDIELAELLLSHTRAALERVTREDDLKRQNERLERVGRIVSHDLRTQLNTARGYIELAQEKSDVDGLAKAIEAHERVDQLLADVSAVVEGGQLVQETTTVDTAELAHTCWGKVAPPSATCEVDTTREIIADEPKLRQALLNLLRNAIEHGGEDVTVRIGDLADGFYIEDDGPGIPEGKREEVFAPDFSTADSGSGLGLAIVQDIVSAHGWSVEVTDGSMGGARFEITGVTF